MSDVRFDGEGSPYVTGSDGSGLPRDSRSKSPRIFANAFAPSPVVQYVRNASALPASTSVRGAWPGTTEAGSAARAKWVPTMRHQKQNERRREMVMRPERGGTSGRFPKAQVSDAPARSGRRR